jgi:NitT/TauT family transport system ATP-binding protein
MSRSGKEPVVTQSKALAIDIDRVTREYETSNSVVHAVQEVSTQVPAGQFVSLLGPSGCGKSTLLRLIAGLEKPTSGHIGIGGVRVEAPHFDLGMIFQKDLLLPWRNVLDNVLLQADVRKSDREASKKRALMLLEQVGLSGFEYRYPRELSGGMRQRVAICRAMLHDPNLLLMDEPYAALDAMTRDQMAVDLAATTEGRSTTVVFVTHSITEAVFLSDRILVMSPRPGRIVADIEVDIPQPRGLHIRELPRFGQLVGQVMGVFEELGVFRSRAQSPVLNGEGK